MADSDLQSLTPAVTDPDTSRTKRVKGVVKSSTEYNPLVSSGNVRSLRSVVTHDTATRMHANAYNRDQLTQQARYAVLAQATAKFGVTLPRGNHPTSHCTESGTVFLLNTPLQRALSVFARRSGLPLAAFVELMRGQTKDDYRPNKNLVPAVIEKECKGYKHLSELQQIVQEGVQVNLKSSPQHQAVRPPNHGSALERLNILRKNIRNKSRIRGDAWSPFGVVDKGDGDASVSGRTIHDLSFPEGFSINDFTDQTSIIKPDYSHCDAVAAEILRAKIKGPRWFQGQNYGGIHSNSVHWFAGLIEEENALVIELAAPFGWTGSPGFYEIFGGAISFIHGSHTNADNPTGFFNYHWVDDHINVAADIGPSCLEIDRSLRYAMVVVLGANAVNVEKFTSWATCQRVLGLLFDSDTETVSMPDAKIQKARGIVASAFFASSLSRKAYRSLMGSLRHVATCIRAARPFLQRLRVRESQLHRFQHVPVSPAMKQDLLWWWFVLHSPQLNGVPMEYFNSLPPPSPPMSWSKWTRLMLACSRTALTYRFSRLERALIAEFNNGTANGFDINFRELLSCAFAVHAWGARWLKDSAQQGRPRHVHFRIDNTSAVAWQNKLSSRNPRAQVIIRLLCWWETSYRLRFSASHIAGIDNTRADAGSRISANPSFAAKFASLTSGWTQVSPTVDIQGLTAIWQRISERIPLASPHLPSTAEL
ncbi:hypothetical protein PHMEG_00025709 [Phytophthora megakarya]|uniref:Reverse transcriptase n=1 Tax=Phytophthora megakarya TaxID=4795 RepID=A0A225VDY8_9STRA|nr:hypothetical protein PHMEG_00025709 [Phytophthora megakarya]